MDLADGVAFASVSVALTDFTTLDTKEACWTNPTDKTTHRIVTAKGSCKAPTFVGASLS